MREDLIIPLSTPKTKSDFISDLLNEILPLKKWTGKCIVDNTNTKFKLHIINDVIPFLDMEKIPDNIIVEIVEKINSECIELDQDMY